MAGVSLSTHYYALVLGVATTRLCEAFRDFLIDIESQGFPVGKPDPDLDASVPGRYRALAQTIDRRFDLFYRLEPLGLVVVGERDLQAAFGAASTHADAVIGRVESDHTMTSAGELGQIVWPVVKQAISGVLDRAMRDLAAAAAGGRLACGIEAAARMAGSGRPATLLVEDGYHVRGHLGGTAGSPIITPDVGVMDTLDDAVDVLIEMVLGSGGNVVFTPRGSLRDRQRMALIIGDKEST